MELLEYIWLGKPLWMWLTFLAIVVTLLALDLGVLHKKQRRANSRLNPRCCCGVAPAHGGCAQPRAQPDL